MILPIDLSSPLIIERPAEMKRLLAALTVPEPGPDGRLVALIGTEGCGKTVLAQAACRDAHLLAVYPDGILWVQLGETPGDLAGRLEALANEISPSPSVEGELSAASEHLHNLLENRRVLIVLDDVHSPAHVHPFLQGGAGCALLAIARRADLLPPGMNILEIGAMRPAEAVELLLGSIPPGETIGLRALATRSGYWPRILGMVGGLIRQRMVQGELAPQAAAYTTHALQLQGVKLTDAQHEVERSLALDNLLSASVEQLDERQQRCFAGLVIFRPDEMIPVAAVHRLWERTEGYTLEDTHTLLVCLWRLALVQVDSVKATLLIPERIHQSLLMEMLEDERRKLHNELLQAYQERLPHPGVWAAGEDDGYYYQHLIYHLAQAGMEQALSELLTDLDWMGARLAAKEAGGIYGLIADYDLAPEGERGLRLVKGALRLSAGALEADATELHGQLYARLLGSHDPQAAAFVARLRSGKGGTWLRVLNLCLLAPGDPLLTTLEGHSGWVLGAVFTPDQNYIISASSDMTLKVWDSENGQLQHTLKGHDAGVRCTVVTPDGKRIVSASDDYTLKIWDLQRGRLRRTLKGHTGWVWGLALTPDGSLAVSASVDRTLRVWDLEKGKQVQLLEDPASVVTAVAALLDGKRVVTGCGDGTLKVWDLESGQVLRTLSGHTGEVNCVVVLPDGKRVLSAADDHTVKVWDLERGSLIFSLEGHHREVNGVTVTPDGRRAVSGGDDGLLKVWDLERGKLIRTLAAHPDVINSVAVSGDGRKIVSASWDRTLKVWDLFEEEAQRAPTWHREAVNGVSITAGGLTVVTASSDRTLKVWDVKSGQVRSTLHELGRGGGRAVAWLDDGQWVISGGGDGRLRVWNVEKGTLERTLEGHWRPVNAVKSVTQGRWALSASDDRSVVIWNVETGKAQRSLVGHRDAVLGAVVLPKARRVISAGAERTLLMWDLDRGEMLRKLGGHSAAVNAVAASADEKWAISASADGTLKVWDMLLGKLLATLEGHRGAVLSVAVLGGSGRVVSTSEDRSLRVWDVHSRRCLAVFSGESAMRCVDASVDGKVIAAGDAIGRLYLLELVEK